MATIHISEAEAARDLPALLARVRAGEDVIIDVAPPAAAALDQPSEYPLGRSIQECIAALPEHSNAVIDEDFARDVEAAVASHPEFLFTGNWKGE